MNRLILLAPLFLCSSAFAQDYPTKAIRIVVTFAAGGTADLLSRAVGAKLAAVLGQPVITDNRPGGGSVIGTDILAKAPPDGYTIGMLISTHAVNPFVMKNLPYDSVNDFAPITLVAMVPGILSVNAGLPVRNVQEMVQLVKSKPGQYNYGLPGSMTSGHLSMELLKVMAGLDMVAIAYKGGAPAAADLASGQVQFMINSPPTVLAFVKAGKVRALAVTAAQRSPGLPDVPTIRESGFPDYDTYEWYGLFAPARVPKEIVARLAQEVSKIVKDAELRERMLSQGAELVGNSPDEFGGFVRAEMERWGGLAKRLNLRAD
ncbi:MAG TPA: tripartite tricarboxylate transporter substrate binding protein [Burkholderiales bacterium]|nr:tripartite tricarboxylate transporter substrate binding protein [Burkholderiales bacterium]